MHMKLIAKCILLFLMILGIQAWSELQHVLALMVIFITVALIKIEGSGFQQYGFQISEKTRKYFLLSLFLAFFYTTVTIFLPGSMSKFEAYPPYYSIETLEKVLAVLLEAVAFEIVFRGYIQTTLTEVFDFPYAALITSIMFTICIVSAGVNAYGLILTLLIVLSAFAESIFLCILFKKTETLLCPILYSASVIFLDTITPLKPISSEYTHITSIVLYILFILMSQYYLNVEKDSEVYTDYNAL